MLGKRLEGFIAALVVAGALGGTSAAVATVSHRSASASSGAAPAARPPTRRRAPRVDEGCRELPPAPVAPPPLASCS
jgi:hypothetical protein